MRVVSCVLAGLSFTWAMSSAIAADSPYHPAESRAAFAKRQMIDCMTKRMAASRTLSYNDASRQCKDQVTQLVAQQTSVAASAPPQKAVSAP